MRKFLALLALILIPSSFLLAQDATTTTSTDKMNSSATPPPPIVKPSRDFIMLQFGYNNWLTKPDSVKTKTFGFVFNGFVCYDFPIKKTKLSFATGIGVNVSVVYLDLQQLYSNDTVSGAPAIFKPDTANFKRYKVVTSYIQAPFELRYYSNTVNRNNGFKAAIGMQVGTLLGAHTKAVTSIDGTNVKYKEDTKRFISPWNFAATARIGWGNFSLFASYNLTNVFKVNDGPPITPASAGLCITGL